ncbi:hypothetical protein [Streptomyces sp. NPDC004788]
MRMTAKGQAVVAAVAVAAVLLGAAGCGKSDVGKPGGAAAASSDSGPFTKERVRAELDDSAEGAGAPPMDPDWAAMEKQSRAGSLAACGVSYRGYGTESERVDSGRYDKVVDELRERGWQQTGERKERKTADGAVGQVQQLFKKRGWTLLAEFRGIPEPGLINLAAGEDACVKQATGR